MSNLKVKGNDNGSGTTTLQSANVNTDMTLTLPSTTGSAGDLLQSDGQGNFSFTAGLPVGSTFYVPTDTALPSSYLKINSDVIVPVGTYPQLDVIVDAIPPSFPNAPTSIVTRPNDGNSSGLDEFPASVDISGNYAIIADKYKNDGCGGAYIYFYNGSSWELQQSIAFSSPIGTNANYGNAVAIDGDYAVIGARNGYAAKIFKRSGVTWSEVAEITNPNPPLFSWLNYFGSTIAISNGRIAISNWAQPVPDPNNPGSTLDYVGAVWVFAGSDSTWTIEATILPPIIASNYMLGDSLAMDGNNLVIGCSSASSGVTGGASGGAILTYSFINNAWVNVGTFFGQSNYPGIGASVAISGNNVAASALASNRVIYVFDSMTLGTPIATLSQPANGSFDGQEIGFNQFAHKVAMSGTTIVISDNYANLNGSLNLTYAGALLFYEIDVENETVTLEYIRYVPSYAGQLGHQLAADTSNIITSASYSPGTYASTGVPDKPVYFFKKATTSTIAIKALPAANSYVTAVKVQ